MRERNVYILFLKRIYVLVLWRESGGSSSSRTSIFRTSVVVVVVGESVESQRSGSTATVAPRLGGVRSQPALGKGRLFKKQLGAVHKAICRQANSAGRGRRKGPLQC